MKNNLIVLLILIMFSKVFPVSLDFRDSAEYLLGTSELISKKSNSALSILLSDTLYTDTAYHFFKLGIAYKGVDSLPKAISCLIKAGEYNPNFIPYSYIATSRIELSRDRITNALSALRTAAENSNILPLRFNLYQQMYDILEEHRDSIGSIPWLEELVGKKDSLVEDSTKIMILAINPDSVSSVELDSIVERLDGNHYSTFQTLITKGGRISKDTLLGVQTLFKLAKIENTLTNFDMASDFLHMAIAKKSFSAKINQKEYVRFRTTLNYNLKNYNKAIKWGKKYDKKYEHLPEIVYIVARSYRGLGKSEAARAWYKRHIKYFPYHPKSINILWYMAWIEENAHRLASAREYYSKLFTNHKFSSKADDSYFRYALSYYKEGNYKKSKTAFENFCKKYSASSLCYAAKFWIAKSILAESDTLTAKKRFRTIAEETPYDYYALQSKRILQTLGDTVDIDWIDTVTPSDSMESWFGKVSKVSDGAITKDDSIRFSMGIKIAMVGMVDEAELILEPFEVVFWKNLRIQYQLSKLYKKCGMSDKSFRLIKKFAWQIPPEYRKNLPLRIYQMLYPNFFKDAVLKNATKYKVEPELVWAIMRQESMFNPEIKSQVGAVGLMQLMPFTAKAVANELNDSTYLIDSLTTPSYNIKFGTYYISTLLDEFGDKKELAIASYNGGPHNVKRWLKINKNDEYDMFIEDIGFSETRNYTKKVLANFMIYKKLGLMDKRFYLE